jgi:hypothetical protein
MKKDNHEGEELIPRIEPLKETPPAPEKDFELLPDKELEYRENSNEKYSIHSKMLFGKKAIWKTKISGISCRRIKSCILGFGNVGKSQSMFYIRKLPIPAMKPYGVH